MKIPLEVRNVSCLSTLVVLLSVQATMLLGVVLCYFPPASPLINDVLPDGKDYLLEPEWESVMYRFFVFFAIALMGIILWKTSNKLGQYDFFARFRLFLVGEAILVVLLSGAQVGIVMSVQEPVILQRIYVGMMTIAVIHKAVFYKRQDKW